MEKRKRRSVRVCGKRCHDAKGSACRCFCGGLFHGHAGAANRDEFRRAFDVDTVPTTEGLFEALTGQPSLFGDGLSAGDDWRKRRDDAIRERGAK